MPGVQVLSLDAPPVNALTREVIKELLTRLTMLRGSEKCGSVVLTSSLPHIFSGGLNIHELHNPEPARLREYLSLVQDIFLSLYAFPKPIVAAITGAAPVRARCGARARR